MAARFWIGGGTTTNWNASPTTNWCATSGGAVRVAAPTSADDVTFDGAGGGNSASVVSAAGPCLSLTFTAGYTNTITINTGQTITVSGAFTDNTAHTWVVSGTGALAINAASTITSGGKTFPGPVTFSGANTKTLAADWTITGALTIGTALTVINSNTLNVGGLTSSFSCSGTSTINITGGTWSGANAIQNNLSFASGASITVSGSVAYNTGTLTNNGATVTTTGSTITIAASTTLNTNGVSWNNISLNTTATITINSLLTATGTMTIGNVAITFAGTSGWNVATLTCSATGASTQTLVNNVTYTITTAFNCFSSRIGTIVLFTSDHASNKAILTLQNVSTTCNVLASFTRIDASAGRPIVSFNGTITTCFNIYSQTNALFRPMESYDRKSRRFYLANKNKSVIYQ